MHALVALVALGGGVAPAPAASAATPVQAIPAPPTTRERHGLALSVGFGVEYGGAGLQARYDLPVRRWLTLSPYAAFGALGALPGPLGLTAALGGRNRLAADLAVAPLGHMVLFLHGRPIDGPVVRGPAAALGYERMGDVGWFFRAMGEYSYAAWGSPIGISSPHTFFFALGVGRKL